MVHVIRNEEVQFDADQIHWNKYFESDIQHLHEDSCTLVFIVLQLIKNTLNDA